MQRKKKSLKVAKTLELPWASAPFASVSRLGFVVFFIFKKEWNSDNRYPAVGVKRKLD